MDFAYPLIGDEVGLEIAVRAFRVRGADGIRKTP